MDTQKVLKSADNNWDWAIDTLKTYLKIPSISAQKKGIYESVQFLLNIFKSLGFNTKLCETNGNPVIFAFKEVENARRTIVFYNHYDVHFY